MITIWAVLYCPHESVYSAFLSIIRDNKYLVIKYYMDYAALWYILHNPYSDSDFENISKLGNGREINFRCSAYGA